YPNEITSLSPGLREPLPWERHNENRTLKGVESDRSGGCNSFRDLCKSGARLCEPQHAVLQIKPLRVTDPRSAADDSPFAEISVGVENCFGTTTQGGRYAPTLG